MAATAEEDLRNLIMARKVHNCFSNVIAFQDSRLDMEISRKASSAFPLRSDLVLAREPYPEEALQTLQSNQHRGSRPFFARA